MRRRYELALPGSCAWEFSAESRAQPWLDRFAALLGLSFDGAGNACGTGKNRIHCRMVPMHSGEIWQEWHGYDSSTGYSIDRFRSVRFTGDASGTINADIGDNGHPDTAIINMWLLLYPVYRSLLQSGGLPFHAAMAEFGGRAYLLTGVSGTGKSTCSRRLQGLWRSRCDDEVLVVPDGTGRYVVHPLPTWSEFLFGKRSEKSWPVNPGLPLGGIFYLKQAEVDRVYPKLHDAEHAAAMIAAVLQVWDKYTWGFDAGQRQAANTSIFDNACRMAAHVPGYRLAVALDGRFWEEMEKVVCDERQFAQAIFLPR